MNVSPSAPRRPGAGKPHILIIDDSTVVRLYYRHLLESDGYEVDEAINGLEGLEKAFGDSYDLCIVDVNMPLMNGYEFLQQLRREPRTRALPALVTTTEASPNDRATAMRAGATEYLVKPVHGEAFTLLVANLLGLTPR